jgi:hypothetical protein
MPASALAWRTGGDDDGLLGALQPLDPLIKLSDARSRSGARNEAEFDRVGGADEDDCACRAARGASFQLIELHSVPCSQGRIA